MHDWKKFVCSMLLSVFVAMWAVAASAQEIVIGYSGPLSGPAAEYGQDVGNGIEMAVNELNAAGGVTVKGKKYSFKLEKLDDRADATQARNNALRLVNQNKAIVVFNPIATTIGAMMSIPEHNFIIAAYSSVHTIMDMGHPMIINPVPNFVTYAQTFADQAYEKGWRNCAMVVTLGAYGDAWRKAFSMVWANKGGRIVGDFPANYYTDTDFSSQLAAAISKKPDFLLVGGPSATSALVIEQARGMGFKGGLVLIDQAKPDYIAKVLKNMNLLEGMISTGALLALPLPATPAFQAKYTAAYKRDMNSECVLNYNVMHVLARTIKATQSLDPKVIRRNIDKGLPTLGDTVPNELFGIRDNGFILCGLITQTVENGKFSKVNYLLTFPKTQVEFQKYKKMSKSKEPEMIKWMPLN